MKISTPTLSRTLCLAFLAGLSGAACVSDTTDTQPNIESLGEDRQPIAWGSNDNPATFDIDKNFNYKLAELPTEGEADVVPWAGSYWPTFRDSINFRWDGSNGDTPGPHNSPAEKFATAFGRDKLVDNISSQFGINSRSTTCTANSECDDAKGEVCSKRPGENEGRCVETWFGVCHAWAPAAIMVPEPKKPVTYNGVTFKVNDIKALISLSYTHAVQTRFLSGRCNEQGKELEYDEYGRPTNRACMNTNPGTFHVVASNMLGLQKKSFVEDKTFDYQVWNQPVRSYKVLQNNAVTAEDANKLITATGSDYLFNDKAVSFHHIKMLFKYIAEPAQHIGGNLSSSIDKYTNQDVYEYVLELDGDGKIIGGEWVGASKKNHPDFLWMPTIKGWTEVAKDGGKAGTGIAWHEVMHLVEESVKEEGGTSGGFDWGDTCDAGNGEFKQPIASKAIVEVGEIPTGKANVRIDLNAENDVDVQLYDKQTGHPIVAWPNGDLNGHSKQSTSYEGITIEYSGYNGVDGKLGHEYIEIKGNVTRPLVMKAFGYKSGDATVTYSYTAVAGCVDTGNGEFKQDVERHNVMTLGGIKGGKSNIRIQLKALNDLDIQLYDGPVALIKWPDGKLSGSGKQTLSYKEMTLEWSGWAGVNGNYGNEYITIRGKVPAELTMRVFGYKEGDADVRYSWGLKESELSQSLF